MAFQTLNFSNKMSSRISLEIKFWITFNTGPETRNFQGASAQIQLAQKGSIFPKKSLIFISKMAILGSFRGGSEVAFVTSVFFALSSVTYCSAQTAHRRHSSPFTKLTRAPCVTVSVHREMQTFIFTGHHLRDAKNIQAYCTCNTTFKILMKMPYLGSSVALCNGSTGPG